MNVNKFYGKMMKRMNWQDIGVLKLIMIFFTLMLVTAWAGFRELVLGVAWYWYLAFWIILTLPMMKKLLKK
jgi:hypothetical protein